MSVSLAINKLCGGMLPRGVQEKSHRETLPLPLVLNHRISQAPPPPAPPPPLPSPPFFFLKPLLCFFAIHSLFPFKVCLYLCLCTSLVSSSSITVHVLIPFLYCLFLGPHSMLAIIAELTMSSP